MKELAKNVVSDTSNICYEVISKDNIPACGASDAETNEERKNQQ